jgi:monothiol glutaredoxin
MTQSPFHILNPEVPALSTEILPETVPGELAERIQHILKNNKIVLFMKGTEHFPQCGFSANTIAILKSFGKPFATFDILKDMDIRQGLKEYSNWPTYPQLYMNGKLLGGNDIITEMHESGDLKDLIDSL